MSHSQARDFNEFPHLPELPAGEYAISMANLPNVACDSYLAVRDFGEVSAGMLVWYADMITRGTKQRGYYPLVAGFCLADAACHPAPTFSLNDRLRLLDQADKNWQAAFSKEQYSANDTAERASWARSQLPTYRSIAHFAVTGSLPAHEHAEQDEKFKQHFRHLLERWDHEPLTGHTVEVLLSYFSHRSNPLRPQELPIFCLPASLRDDFHPEADRRVDDDVFDLQHGLKYGAQLKAGKASDPFSSAGVQRRIFINNAAKMLGLPFRDKPIKRTIEAIVDNTYELDLDVLAIGVREQIRRFFADPEYISTPIRQADPGDTPR